MGENIITYVKFNVSESVFNNRTFGNAPDRDIPVTNVGERLKEIIDSILDPTSGMTEKQKADFTKELHRKIEHGEKLTADEMQYLRINDPIEYAKMAKVQIQRQALEDRLKSCKTKEEARDVYIEAMSRINQDDPTIKETMAAYNNVYKEFTQKEAICLN